MTDFKPNARTFIIDLLLASGGQPISIKQMVKAATIFQINENSIRVAVTRLSNEKSIESIARGIYQLTEASHEWASIILDRSHGIKNTKLWNQQYLAVFTNTLGRVDRTALSRRERALKRFGFQELEVGIFIRPDNLTLTIAEIFNQLIDLGLESEAKICLISTFDEQTTALIPQLWDLKKLNQNYQKYSSQLESWLSNVSSITLEQAARESFLLGRETIALLMKDPLLPEPFVNTQLRENFSQKVMQLDQIGLKIWNQLNENAND